MSARTTLMVSTLIAASLVTGAAHAALEGRDLNGSAGSFEAYYDTVLDITWLADGNANGLMNWAAANTWAANLSFIDGINTYDNWRLPSTLQPDATCGNQYGGVSFAFGCNGSEMGRLFYSELGGVAGQSITLTHNANYNLFSNVLADYYWSGTEYAPNTIFAWGITFNDGFQGANYKYDGFYALAVSPGDVAAVPEADTRAMLLAGLGLVGAAVGLRKAA